MGTGQTDRFLFFHLPDVTKDCHFLLPSKTDGNQFLEQLVMFYWRHLHNVLGKDFRDLRDNETIKINVNDRVMCASSGTCSCGFPMDLFPSSFLVVEAVSLGAAVEVSEAINL